MLLVAAVGGVVLGHHSRKLDEAASLCRSAREGSMLGPDVTWYVASAMLFAIGALGVLLRRKPLIILLSLEIMLNGGEPRADRVLAAQRRRDGQVFAIAVMAVAAAEVVVGLGLIVAMSRRRLRSTSTA